MEAQRGAEAPAKEWKYNVLVPYALQEEEERKGASLLPKAKSISVTSQMPHVTRTILVLALYYQ